MAITKVCAVRDRAVDGFGQPIFVISLGQALRSFKDEINRKDGAMGQHPEDYDLYEIGDYDDNTGAIMPTPIRMIAVGKDLVENPF